ncbi:MAG: hypothetical protein DMD38_07860 [Gemmatimonadetes bacterium]|nr:MAG: hypothetical protein AUI86_09970 [Gemmatimonadetes bacterium 13_1_40CM_3_66_12]PYP96515.1 MAG: hypothetical protein DMD38_07860 [Gemmatimonadota bacterium]
MRKALVLALCVGLAARAAAQAGSSVSADAVVVTVGMTISTLRDLNFGTVIKGVPSTILPTAVNAGEWQVSGSANAFVIISFTLPTQLTNIQALPGSTMPIAFSALAAIWRRSTNNPVGGTVFNPALGSVGRFGPPANPTMYVWIGGTVAPAVAAKPGIYQGNVIVSLVYQ